MNATTIFHQGTLDLIHARTSVAHFDPGKEMDDETVAALIGHASQAPSSYNLQNWRFVAVKSVPRKAVLCELAYGQRQVVDASVTFIVVGALDGHERIRDVLLPMQAAGHLDAQGVDEWARDTQRSMADNPVKQRDEAIRSGSLAAMTLMLAAQAMGWVSAPLGGFDAAGLAQAFGLTPNELPVMLVSVGQPGPGNWPRKARRPVREVLEIV
ncbi:MAG TPA: nitroreductase family protein [Hydrogenophaga sp.]